jgi:hypothetical protein
MGPKLMRQMTNSLSALVHAKLEVMRGEKSLDKRLQSAYITPQSSGTRYCMLWFFLGVGCMGLSVASRTEFCTRRIASEKLGEKGG